MRSAAGIVLCLILVTPGAGPAGEIWSPGKLTLTGLAETRFHPLAGTFECVISKARLAQDPDAVSVFVNDMRLDSASIHPSDSEIRIDYRFRPGLNEVLVEAVDRDGLRLRADALIWAGSSGLIVNVMDADGQPVSDAEVSVTLNEQSSVHFDGRTRAGNLYIKNLPPEPVTVSVRHERQNLYKIVDPAVGHVSLIVP